MNRAVVLAAAFAVACGGGKASTRPDSSSDQTPSWLSEGTGAIRGESGRRLQGVGVASGVSNPKARRRQADGAAREQLQAAVDALARALAKGGDSPQDAGAVRGIARKAATQVGAIRDHWVTPDGDERALGVIELDAFKRALQSVDADDRVRSEMFSNLDRAFDQVAAAGTR
jgi:hypothetical protein